MKILSLSTVFPNPQEPGLGPFVRARLDAMGRYAEVRVVAPIAPFDYDNPGRRGIGRRTVPLVRSDGAIERIYHPAWLYPPGNKASKGPLLAAQLAPRLARIRAEFPFDILDAHFLHPDGVAAAILARLFRTPFTATLRGNELTYSKQAATRTMMRWAARRAAAAFALSGELERLAIDLGAAPSRVQTVGNGVDAAVYKMRGEPPPREGRRAVIFAAGRLAPVKRFDRMIRAVRSLVDGGLDVQLDIAGGPSRGLPDVADRLRSLSAELGVADRVNLLGWTAPEETARRMSAADVFCMASEREGWPNVVAEALACGAPAAATDVGEAARIIGDRRYGLCVPEGDQAALVSALDQALRRRWDRNAIARHGSLRTWDAAAREVIARMRAVLDEPAAYGRKTSP